MLVAERPESAQKAIGAFDTGVRPLQGLLGWAGEHHKQSGRVRTLGVDQ